jgi:hypothetical protein
MAGGVAILLLITVLLVVGAVGLALYGVRDETSRRR